MKYIKPNPNPSGAYPPPQSKPAPGLISISDEQADMLIEYNGFVTIKNGTVTPNLDAWEKWRQEQTEPTAPEPTPQELTEQEITELQLENIEQGQEITELQLNMLEVKA